MTGEFAIPPDWAAQVSGYPADPGPTGAAWIAELPRQLADIVQRWGVEPDGPPRTGWTACVWPVRRDGEPLALKAGWPHWEATHEALALRLWDGAGAVRLVAAEPRTGFLLLERARADRDLSQLDADAACEVIGDLLRRLRRPAPPQLLRVSDYLPPRLDRLGQTPALPRRVVIRTQSLAQDLLAEVEPNLLLHTDLHFGNVLAAQREPWLAIDPKPMAGPAGFELLPVLQNRVDELGTGASFRAGVRRRVEVTAEAAQIDPELARLWTLVRLGAELPYLATRGPEILSFAITLYKALDD